MDSEVSLLIDRAENELVAARVLKQVSGEDKIKKILQIDLPFTFYSSVISHSYYAIFYSAKAYLASKKIELLSEQGLHQQVYFKFRKLVQQGIIDEEMLSIYEDLKIKAESLLEIFDSEREKRKTFTYMTIPQANQAPAEDSIKNAEFFVSHIKEFVREKDKKEGELR